MTTLATPPTMMDTTPTGRTSAGPDFLHATDLANPKLVPRAGSTSLGHVGRETHSATAQGTLRSLTLGLAADVLDDLEKSRIANENRLRALGEFTPDAHPELKRLRAIVDGLRDLEHKAGLNLDREMRAHPLGVWVLAQRGVGVRQAARLLAAIGDPYVRDTYGEDGTATLAPRTVAQLWSYCGYSVIDGAAARRRKGVKSNWSSVAKARAYLIAESCMKAGGDYRKLYDARKKLTEGRIHAGPCPQCHNAEIWRDGHRHADALRVVAKEVLRDLWCEARRLHEEGIA